MVDQHQLFVQGGLFEEPDPQVLTLPNAELNLWRHFLGAKESRQLFDVLLEELAWEQSQIQVYGRPVSIPRLNVWYADADCDYSYSGLQMTRHDWHPMLRKIKDKIEATVGRRFNSVLANCYRDGADSVGWHADNEPELGRNPVIASLSLGATRRFLIKHRQRKDLGSQEFQLTDGSLLLMGGEMQHFWYHAIPKSQKVSDTRINLTFRYVFPPS